MIRCGHESHRLPYPRQDLIIANAWFMELTQTGNDYFLVVVPLVMRARDELTIKAFSDIIATIRILNVKIVECGGRMELVDAPATQRKIVIPAGGSLEKDGSAVVRLLCDQPFQYDPDEFVGADTLGDAFEPFQVADAAEAGPVSMPLAEGLRNIWVNDNFRLCVFRAEHGMRVSLEFNGPCLTRTWPAHSWTSLSPTPRDSVHRESRHVEGANPSVRPAFSGRS